MAILGAGHVGGACCGGAGPPRVMPGGTGGSTWPPGGAKPGPTSPPPLSLCPSAKSPPHRLMPPKSKPKRPALRFPGLSTPPDRGSTLLTRLGGRHSCTVITGGPACRPTCLGLGATQCCFPICPVLRAVPTRGSLSKCVFTSQSWTCHAMRSHKPMGFEHLLCARRPADPVRVRYTNRI